LFCNGTDYCLGGACIVHSGDPCVAGSECQNACDEANKSCANIAGTPCSDDGDLCTNDRCDGAGSCAHLAEVSSGCFETIRPASSLINVRADAAPTKDALSWKWTKGAATALVDFGDPTISTDYAICVYDRNGGPGTVTLKVRGDAPAGNGWRPLGSRGFAYSSSTLTPDGIRGLKLFTGSTGRAEVRVSAKGSRLFAEVPPYSTPVVVQLKASNGRCWDATFTHPRKNILGKFIGNSN
jgi:hypothetical protein